VTAATALIDRNRLSYAGIGALWLRIVMTNTYNWNR